MKFVIFQLIYYIISKKSLITNEISSYKKNLYVIFESNFLRYFQNSHTYTEETKSATYASSKTY